MQHFGIKNTSGVVYTDGTVSLEFSDTQFWDRTSAVSATLSATTIQPGEKTTLTISFGTGAMKPNKLPSGGSSLIITVNFNENGDPNSIIHMHIEMRFKRSVSLANPITPTVPDEPTNEEEPVNEEEQINTDEPINEEEPTGI